MTFLGIVVCQIGTAFAARTEHASLRSVGVFTNRLLLWGIAFELVFAAAVVTLPTAAGRRSAPLYPNPTALALLVPFPFIVWGADEAHRAFVRHAPTAERGSAPRLLPWPEGLRLRHW